MRLIKPTSELPQSSMDSQMNTLPGGVPGGRPGIARARRHYNSRNLGKLVRTLQPPSSTATTSSILTPPTPA